MAHLIQMVEQYHGKKGVVGSSPIEGFLVFTGLFHFLFLRGFGSVAIYSPCSLNSLRRRHVFSVPVRDDPGVVELDHSNTGADFSSDLGARARTGSASHAGANRSR
jgi:hypothetical protein